MVIKLIQPKMEMRPMDTQLKIRMSPPLGLLTIAHMFEKEHRVILENENVTKINFEQPVDLVGITVTVDAMPRAVEIARAFQDRKIPVVAGGIHVTLCPDETEPFFDAISIGMAEYTWPDIVEDMKNHRLKKRYQCHQEKRGEDIVSPGYHLLDQKEYLYCNVISTSRGCPFQCDFCYNSCGANQKVYLNRPIEHVISEIKAIGKRHVMFIDDNFIGNPKWTREFVRAIRPMNLKWNAAVSANIVDLPELMDEMAESGCQSLFVGFESINETSIQTVHKGQNVRQKFETLIGQIHQRGMMVNGSFVFGLDGDDETTFERTLDWIVKNKIETVTSHILTPYPGTKVYEKLKKENRIIDDDLSHYNTAHVVFQPKKMTPKELYKGYLWMYQKIYSFENIVKRMPNAKEQRVPYLLFNLFYRKFGKLTQYMCDKISYEWMGEIAERFSHLK